MVAIRVYVEGGGDYRERLAKCRHGFSELFRKVMPPKCMPRVIACGNRNETFDRFCTAARFHSDTFCVLLVDSEGPVAAGAAPWDYLENRDRWHAPPGTNDEHVHLMVQVMEAWFLADKDALQRFYGQGFTRNALSRSANVEAIPKDDVLTGLKNATRNTRTKGKYGKGAYSFDILAVIDANLLRKASPNHAARLFDTLVRKSQDQQP